MRNVIPKDARVIPPQAKRVFQGVIFDVYQWQQPLFDGSSGTFEMLKRPDTIEIIAVKDGKIVVLEEEQPAHPMFYGLPGGRHDREDESELDAGRRELAEETGLKFKTWKLLDVKQLQSKIDHFLYRFLATDFDKAVEQQLDAGEKITVKLLSFDEVKTLLGDPRARYLGQEIFEQVSSLDELLNLPSYPANARGSDPEQSF